MTDEELRELLIWKRVGLKICLETWGAFAKSTPDEISRSYSERLRDFLVSHGFSESVVDGFLKCDFRKVEFEDLKRFDSLFEVQ